MNQIIFSIQLDDEEAKKKEEEKLEDEFFDADDEFFKEYRAKLMSQMQQRLLNAYDILIIIIIK